jgi:hypothetical protein
MITDVRFRFVARPRRLVHAAWAAALLLAATAAGAADVVPPAVHMPGTQPGEVSGIESVSKCDNCHGNFDPSGEPWFNWAGSMMAHASRDPIFWATVAIAEQDFDGSGDLCLRCHVPEGWLDGRSTPTDGSGLAPGDADGVQCDVCHRLVNPDGSEHDGEQFAPFLAHDEGSPPTAYLGSGAMVLSDGNAKLGPYADAEPNHQFAQSLYHRSSDLCGTCHDVSNPVTGDLAHNNGAQIPLPPGTASGDPASPVDQKAAFNAFPYQYGVVERTFSEHQASGFPALRAGDVGTLPLELQQGSILRAAQAAQLAGNGGDYEDGTPRYFTCQTCHMRPTVGQACNKNPPVRSDLPVHDLTGGNYWIPQAMEYLDAQDALVLGGGLSATQESALLAGSVRAQQNLDDAAALAVNGNRVRIVNLTGHKLISGYPEGRRMWLQVAWYDVQDQLLAEDGAYGPIFADVDGSPTPVETLLELDPPYTTVYEVHGGLTQEWANQLLGLGTSPDLALAFDRESGAVTKTLGELGAEPPGSAFETFHFVLNNAVLKDNRIPPWGLRYDDAVVRNIVPVPAAQYGDPGPGETYEYFDEVTLNPPPGADHATVRLLYQPTSWEYVQFLERANTGDVAHLAEEGDRILEAWLNTGMASPYPMATASWQPGVAACADGLDNDGDGLVDATEDPGCADAADGSENDPALPCDDRLDDDGDGWTDFPRDPGCQTPTWVAEDPQCSDGIDNDNDGFVDWDGGGVGSPDPHCASASDNREAKNKSCGMGFELALPLGLLLGVWGWRRRRQRGAGAG